MNLFALNLSLVDFDFDYCFRFCFTDLIALVLVGFLHSDLLWAFCGDCSFVGLLICGCLGLCYVYGGLLPLYPQCFDFVLGWFVVLVF